MRNWWKIALLVVMAIACGGSAVKAQSSGPERALFDSANRERVTIGLKPLEWDDALAKAALRHASLMAERSAISHQFPGEAAPSVRAEAAGARFQAMAENVAVGGSAAEIHRMWMNSPPHRENLLDPELNSIGIAVAEHAGQLYAVQDFSQALVALSIEEQEKQVMAAIKERGVAAKSSADARDACVQTSGTSARSSYWMRYSTGDLDALPRDLNEKIGSGRYRTAAVGACESESSGLALYDIAVLLYQ